jgi:hypothetical protein
MSMAQLRRTVQMREHIVEACRLVASRPSVRGVHIVAKGQPTSDELRQYQDYAATCHVSLAVDSHGMISIRPGAAEEK